MNTLVCLRTVPVIIKDLSVHMRTCPGMELTRKLHPIECTMGWYK